MADADAGTGGQSILEQTLTKRNHVRAVKKQQPWLVVNLAGAVFCAYQLQKIDAETTLASTAIWLTALLVCLVLAMNFATGVFLYVKRTRYEAPVVLSPEQKRVLGVKNNEIGFVTSTPSKSPIEKPKAAFQYLPVGSSPSSPTMKPLPTGTADATSPGDRSAASSSWQFQKGSQSSLLYSSQNWDLEEELYEEESLMKLYKSMEKDQLELQTSKGYGQDASAMSTSASSWHYSPSHTGIADYSPLLTKYTYQLSSYTVPAPGASGVDESASTKSPAKMKGRDIWQQLDITGTDLVEYNEKIRLWLSSTVLQPLVAEIQRINESLTTHGMADARIGESSLEKLRKTCQLAPVATNVPSLVKVLPYLEVTTHQDYLVRCLHDLASGGCMGSFRWDGGAKRKMLDDGLPTDSAVAMHCLATYLDSQLPAFTDRPDRRPFSGHYLVKCPEKPPASSSLPLIVEVSTNPPHYKLVLETDEYELPKGRNNFLHTIILFFWLIKTKFDGRLGRISLDKGGLDLLWIFS